MTQIDNTINTYLTELIRPEIEFDALEFRFLMESEQIIQEMSLSDLKNSYKKIMPKIEEILQKHDIDVDSIKKEASKYTGKLKKMYDDGISSEDASKKLVSDTKDFLVKKLHPVILKYKEDKAKHIFLAIIISISVFMCCVFLESITIKLVGDIVTIIVFAPMIEEAAKNYFIKTKIPWLGTGITFGIELINYVLSLMMLGATLPQALLLRIPGLMMHFVTTFIQKKIMDKKENEEDEETVKKNHDFKAWVIGVSLHSAWNLLGVIYNLEILRFVTRAL